MTNSLSKPRILVPLSRPLLLQRPSELVKRWELELPTWEDIKDFISSTKGKHKKDGGYVASFGNLSLHPTISSFSELGGLANCSLELHREELGITLYSPKLLDTRRQNYSIFPVELGRNSSEYVVVNTPTITLMQSMKSTPQYYDTPFEVVCGLFHTLGLTQKSSQI